MSNQYLSFDVTKQSTPQQLITGRQGDSQLKFVTMLFWDGDKNVPYDLTGKQVAFEALKPDNTHIVDHEGITVLDAPAGLVRYSFNEQVFSVAGTVQQAFFKITHTDSNKNVIADSTLEVAINILENRVEFGINSKDYLSEYDDLITQVKKKFDDYAATVKDSIDKAQALHDQIVNYTNLINSNSVILKSDFGDISSIKQPLGKTFVDKLNNEFNDRGINVKWFGAVGDGKTDDTKAIQAAINFFKNSDFKTLIFEGTFLCSKVSSDSDNREYALIFDTLENKNIDLTRAKFITGAVDDMPNLLVFYNCSNINITGGQAEANTSALVTPLKPYIGAFIYANKCTNINIKNTYSKNMCYTAGLFNCNMGCIKNNIFTHTQQLANRKLRPASAILLYNSSHFKVLENDVNGGLRDGDISVFGAGSYFNLVAFNHLRSDGTNWEEAITVDGGAVKTVVSNNIVEGSYNYGIDVKYNSENTLVISNTVEKCVVAIDVRGGEIDPNAQVFQTVIHDNNIILGDIPSSQGWGDHRQTGISIDNQNAADVKGNHLTLGRKYDVNYPIYGIMVSQPSSPSPDYISQIDISNNFIELKNGINADEQLAGNGSTALCLDTIMYGNITNNDIKAPIGDLAVKILGKNKVIKFSANHFITDGGIAIQYYGDAGCNNLIITDDNYYQAGNLTNAYMYQTTFNNNNQTYILSQKTFGSAKANPFFFITSKWDNNVILHVNMKYDHAGTFIVDSTYKLGISIKSGITVVPIDEHNSDVKLSAGNISENMFGLCAKATRDCPDISNLVVKVTVISSDTTNVFS